MARTTPADSVTLERLVELAKNNDAIALESLLARLREKIHDLARKKLWCPEDSRDATQEILLRVMTHLNGFRCESAFMTWVYRVAINYLNTMRRARSEERYTFQSVSKESDESISGLEPSDNPTHTDVILVEEIRIGRSMAMLLFLDRAHRVAYLLGEILELESEEAASMLKIPAATFRKRLSRARMDIVNFMRAKWGVTSEINTQRSRHRLACAIAASEKSSRVRPDSAAGGVALSQRALRHIQRVEYYKSAAALYRSHPELRDPARLARLIRNLVRDPLLHPNERHIKLRRPVRQQARRKSAQSLQVAPTPSTAGSGRENYHHAGAASSPV